MTFMPSATIPPQLGAGSATIRLRNAKPGLYEERGSGNKRRLHDHGTGDPWQYVATDDVRVRQAGYLRSSDIEFLADGQRRGPDDAHETRGRDDAKRGHRR